MRLRPDTLAGRTLLLLLGTTLLLVIGSALLLHDERRERFDERNRFHLLERITTLVRLLEGADDDERRHIIERVSDQNYDIKLSDQPSVRKPPSHPIEHFLSRKLRRELRIKDRSAVRVHVVLSDDDRHEYDDDDDENESHHKRRRTHELNGIDIALRLWDDTWVNIHTEAFGEPPPWAGKTLQLLLLLLALLTAAGIFIARRMARPMAQLADAADRFGLGHEQQALAEKGPREVRQTIRAFNRMQDRLHRHITDRSRMLAAVSHDLRTPITTLRLRAEYIEDDEMREKTLATLAEMEAILSDTLSFARDEAADEKSRATDLAALLQTLVDEHTDLGGKAVYDGPDKLTFTCRPVALKRALNNLIDNALKYGESVTARLSETDAGIEIQIDDQGPGIPADKLDEVFSPFYRLEVSRNRETGGTGLGLAVARTIAFAHGGDLTLENRPDGGLRALVKLPRSAPKAST